MQKSLFCSLISLVLVFVGNAAEQDFKVSVESIRETRWHVPANDSNRWNSCTLQLKFEGKITQTSMGVLEVRPIKVTNDVGENLLRSLDQPRGEWSVQRAKVQPRLGGQATGSLLLPVSSRKATTLTIEGEVDFFQPTDEARVVISNLILHADTWLKSPQLEEAGVKLMYVGRENYDAYLTQLAGQAPAFHVASGAVTNPDTRKCALRFRIEGEAWKVARIEVSNSAGKTYSPRRVSISDKYRVIDFAEPPPTDSRLVIYLDIPEARHSVPFQIENVDLP